MKIKQPYKIAENDAGFEFYVGTLGGRWIGFAISASDSGNRMLIVLDVSEGFILGMSEKTRSDTKIACFDSGRTRFMRSRSNVRGR